MKDKEGNNKGIIGISTDITERIKAEETLKESEMRYRSFVENFHGIAVRGDFNFTPFFFHGDVEKITGYTEDEFISGKPRIDQIIHPDDFARISKEGEIEKVYSVPNYSAEHDYRIYRKDGKIRWIRQFIENITDDSGEPKYVQGVLYDITDSKKAEDELKENEKTAKAILNATKDMLLLLDTKGTIIKINDTTARTFNMNMDDMVGLNIFEFFPPDVAKSRKEKVKKVIKSGKSIIFDSSSTVKSIF